MNKTIPALIATLSLLAAVAATANDVMPSSKIEAADLVVVSTDESRRPLPAALPPRLTTPIRTPR